jgi:hypothetical protein
MKEGLLKLSTQQAIAGAASQISSNVFDATTIRRLFGGFGEPFKILVTVTAIAGTTPNFRARLVAADNAALTTNPIDLWETGLSRTLVAADIPWIYEQVISGQQTAKQFYGMFYTQTGNADNSATVNCIFANAHQNNLLR